MLRSCVWKSGKFQRNIKTNATTARAIGVGCLYLSDITGLPEPPYKDVKHSVPRFVVSICIVKVSREWGPDCVGPVKTSRSRVPACA